MSLQLGNHNFNFNFLLAAVDKNIIGNDFLAHFNLLVDPGHHQVLVAATLEPIGGDFSSTCSPPSSSTPSLASSLLLADADVRILLSRFPSVLAAPDGMPGSAVKGVEHVIETSGQPVFAKARRLDPDKLRAAKAEFIKLEKAGIIRRSDSQWASPLHMVRKSDGSWRPCGDYRRLNNNTAHDNYPLPNVQDFTAGLHGCNIFSKIDLVKGYLQVPVAKRDIQKTAIVTPFGLFEFLRMPFGLRNAAQTFQRLMDSIFRDVPYCFIYLDDILVASSSPQQHHSHLQHVFQLLQENQLVVNIGKCVFAQPAVEFLGHRVSEEGIVPLTSHVEAVSNFPQPTEIKQLQKFLGMVNYYRRFLPGIARTLRPLTDSLAGQKKHLAWTAECTTAFEAAKSALISATRLTHPAPAATISLATDASDTHIGGVLQQWQQGGWRPLGFFSGKLSGTQMKYSTFDRELTAAFLAIRHFRSQLEGRQFTLYTDHKPLVAALGRLTPPWSARQQRQLAYIAEFTSDVRHIPGANNHVADALSRPPAASPHRSTPMAAIKAPSGSAAIPVVGDLSAGASPSPSSSASSPSSSSTPSLSCAALTIRVPSAEELATAQSQCAEVAAMKGLTSLQIATVPIGKLEVFGDISTGTFRPLTPVAMRKTIFDALHGGAHPGARATRRIIAARYVWPGLSKDVTLWSRECLNCQQSKIHQHVRLRAAEIPMPARRFEHVHVDLVGPLPASHGFTHLFTIIDRSTRWCEAVPLMTTSTTDCAAALFHGWISRFGVPQSITSDRGAQFTSAIWSSLCNVLNINHRQTSAYHPQANGLVERMHRRLKDALRARATSANWLQDLPWVLLSIRTAPREDTSVSAAENVYGTPLVVPGQFLSTPEPPAEPFFQDLRQAMSQFSATKTRHNTPEDKQPPAQLPPDLYAGRVCFS